MVYIPNRGPVCYRFAHVKDPTAAEKVESWHFVAVGILLTLEINQKAG